MTPWTSSKEIPRFSVEEELLQEAINESLDLSSKECLRPLRSFHSSSTSTMVDMTADGHKISNPSSSSYLLHWLFGGSNDMKTTCLECAKWELEVHRLDAAKQELENENTKLKRLHLKWVHSLIYLFFPNWLFFPIKKGGDSSSSCHLKKKQIKDQEKLDQERSQMTEEVQSLTQQVFQEANRMVAEERRHSAALVQVNTDLMNRLQKVIQDRSRTSGREQRTKSSSDDFNLARSL